MSEHKKDPALARPSGKRYESVNDLMAGLDLPESAKEEMDTDRKMRRLTLELAMMRTKAGVTQGEIARHLGITQGAVSKLENGNDDDVTVRHLKAYVETTKCGLGLKLGKQPNHVEAIKSHAMGIRFHMKELAKLAHNDSDIERGIQAFFGEAFFNILDILSECQGSLPNGNDFQLRLEVVDARHVTRSILCGDSHASSVVCAAA